MVLMFSVPTGVAIFLVSAAVAAALGWAIVRRSPASIFAAALVAALAILSPSSVVWGLIVAIPGGVVYGRASLRSRRA